MPTRDDTNRIIESLVSDTTPVRRLPSASLRLALWTAALVGFAVYVASGGVRPDLAHQLAAPGYIAELAVLCTAILLFARASLGAGIPGDSRWGLAALGAAAMSVGLAFVVAHPAHSDLTISAFTATGFPCAVRTTLLSLLPTAWLLAATYRGLALSPLRAGTVAGAAGFLFGFTLMRLLCQLDDPLHVTAWHWTPVLLGSAVSAFAGTILFARKRRP